MKIYHKAGTQNKSNVLLKKADIGQRKPQSRVVPSFGYSYGIPSEKMKGKKILIGETFVGETAATLTQEWWDYEPSGKPNYDLNWKKINKRAVSGIPNSRVRYQNK